LRPERSIWFIATKHWVKLPLAKGFFASTGRAVGAINFAMTKSDKYRVVLVTAPKITVARKLARLVLEERLAACVNIVRDVESHYWWEGKVCRDAEVLLVMKTAKARLKALEKQVIATHPYDTPEFVVLPVEAGSKRYLDWLGASMA